MAINNVNIPQISNPRGSWNYGDNLPSIDKDAQAKIEERLKAQTGNSNYTLADFAKLSAQDVADKDLGWVSAALNDKNYLDSNTSDLNALFNGLGDGIKLSDEAKKALNPNGMPVLPVNPDDINPETLEEGVKGLQDSVKEGKYDLSGLTNEKAHEKVEGDIAKVGKQKEVEKKYYDGMVNVKANQFTAEYEKQRNDKIEAVYGKLADVKDGKKIAQPAGKIQEAQNQDLEKVTAVYGKTDETVADQAKIAENYKPESGKSTIKELKKEIGDYDKTENIARLTEKQNLYTCVDNAVTSEAVGTARDKYEAAYKTYNAEKQQTPQNKQAMNDAKAEWDRLKEIREYLDTIQNKIQDKIKQNTEAKKKALEEISNGKAVTDTKIQSANATETAVKARNDEKTGIKAEIEAIQAKVKAGNISGIDIPAGELADVKGIESIKGEMLALRGRQAEREKELTALEDKLIEARDAIAEEKDKDPKAKVSDSGKLADTLGKIGEFIGNLANLGLQAQAANAQPVAMPGGVPNMQFPQGAPIAPPPAAGIDMNLVNGITAAGAKSAQGGLAVLGGGASAPVFNGTASQKLGTAKQAFFG